MGRCRPREAAGGTVSRSRDARSVRTSGAGCGTAKTYSLDLNFVAGATFANGDPLSIYGTILLGTQVHAGGCQYNTPAGTASAFIDPTITLNPLFNWPLYSLNVGNAITLPPPGAVPEPAGWTLLLAGFGVVGGMTRRSRPRTIAAQVIARRRDATPCAGRPSWRTPRGMQDTVAVGCRCRSARSGLGLR